MSDSTEVMIVGAGPTGLLLGCLLAQRRIPFGIVEKSEQASSHSRSIGIHPPSLALFERIGLLDRMLERGNRVDGGRAFLEGKRVGQLSFGPLKTPHPFVLTLPQSVTEQLLEERLRELAPQALKRAISITRMQRCSAGFELTSHADQHGSARTLIACDGKRSLIRQQAGIGQVAQTYQAHYVMGDFEDHLGDRHQAHVHLSRQGLVESFPHGRNLRRWVAWRPDERPLEIHDLVSIAKTRTGTAPDPATCTMFSCFTAERMIAHTFHQDRLLLAGDAAHVVSPIGGQGMNLGWMDCADYAEALASRHPAALQQAAQRARIRARRAARQAEFNMAMGRPFSSLLARRILIGLMLRTPIRRTLTRRFTMLHLSARS